MLWKITKKMSDITILAKTNNMINYCHVMNIKR